MRNLVRSVVVVAVAALVGSMAAPAGADGAQSVPYTCAETANTPELSATVPLTTSDDVDPAGIFEPIQWTAEIGLPPVEPPFDYTDGPTNATFIEPVRWANALDLINEFTPTSPPAASGTTVKPKAAAKRTVLFEDI